MTTTIDQRYKYVASLEGMEEDRHLGVSVFLASDLIDVDKVGEEILQGEIIDRLKDAYMETAKNHPDLSEDYVPDCGSVELTVRRVESEQEEKWEPSDAAVWAGLCVFFAMVLGLGIILGWLCF